MIGLVTDRWAAKTIRRHLKELDLDSVVLSPKSNVRIPDGLDAVIYLPKAISHGAADRAREWHHTTGKPVICLAKNCNLIPELERAGILTKETPMPAPAPTSPPPAMHPLSPEVLACRRAAHGPIAAWFRGLFALDPQLSHDRLSTHPDWNPKKSPQHYSLARLAYREKEGLFPWARATKGMSRKTSCGLPVNFGPKVEPPAPAPLLDPPRLDYPSPPKAKPAKKAAPTPKPKPKAKQAPPPSPAHNSAQSAAEEIRTAVGMLRELLRRCGVQGIEIPAWGPVTLTNMPSVEGSDDVDLRIAAGGAPGNGEGSGFKLSQDAEGVVHIVRENED